jgi:hypothetical protein
MRDAAEVQRQARPSAPRGTLRLARPWMLQTMPIIISSGCQDGGTMADAGLFVHKCSHDAPKQTAALKKFLERTNRIPMHW